MKILADASLSNLEDFFPNPFKLSLFSNQNEVPALLADNEILLCRSTLRVNSELLTTHKLRYVATASSGRDHLDAEFLASQNISILDANGSNAMAVVDYVLSCIAYLQKYKHLNFETIGIIGKGSVGSLLAEVLKKLKFRVLACDPDKMPEQSKNYPSVLQTVLAADVVCIHANLHDNHRFATRNLISTEELKYIKPYGVLINAARGGIVDEAALVACSKPFYYCTDVFVAEPNINKKVVDLATLCTPHIAGHTVEAKKNALRMLSEQLHHAYKLPLPDYSKLTIDINNPKAQDFSWQDLILNNYNPMNETLKLKETVCKKESFLTLRKAHQTRHDSKIVSYIFPKPLEFS